MCLLRVADWQIRDVICKERKKKRKDSTVAGSLNVTNGAVLPLTDLIHFELATNVEESDGPFFNV